MKKYLKITLSITILVLIGYFVYTHFKKTSVLLNVIHKDAESVIKIDVHDITKTLVLDALASPNYYWEKTQSFKNKKKKDSIKKEDIGVDLRPYSVVFYTIKNIDNTFFTTLKIDDSEAFESYVNKYSEKKSKRITNDDKGYKYILLEKDKLIIAWNSEKIAAAVTTNSAIDKLKTVFEDVLLGEKLISDKTHAIIEKLSETSEHVAYLNKESLMTLSFEDGQTIIGGTFYTKQTDAYKTNTAYDSFSEASLQLYFDANFNNKDNKNVFAERLKDLSFFTKNNIEASELAERTNGFFSLGVKGTTTQLDTIVSYEYNDNFDKVAVKTLQEKKAPKMSISIGANKGESLKDYLKNQGAITNDIVTGMPYYIFHAKEDSNKITFTTTGEKIKTEQKNSSSFFKLDVNFNRLQEDISIPGTNDVFALVEALKIEASQIEGTNQVKVKGNLTGKDEDINIISQIFFGLQTKKTNQDL